MKRIVLYLLGIIVLFSLVSMVVSKIIYDGQFPRYERHDETVSAKLRYGDLEADYPRQLVDFKSGDNLLKGYIYGSENSLGLVVVAHGLGGGADSYLPQIINFVDHGWRVFAYDATGSFDSEGKTTKGFPQALLDLDAALNYIDSIASFEALPVVLFGHSWGGYAVANVLHFDHEIAGVDEITNPKVETIVQSDPGRNGHNSLFKSEAAVTYIEKVNVEYKALYEQYDENIPYEIRQEFYLNIDRALAQDLDDDLMGEIQQFFLKCIR
ncbi:MAG: alpha/beta fold hydrolase [Clostridia bacterium]|nr:alpha/beta fold hydrolase [Clostridia bacterium]